MEAFEATAQKIRRISDMGQEIQLHDATMTSLEARAGGRIVLRLEGATVYRPESHELYEIEIYDAELAVSGVTELSIRGSWSENDDDYILEDAVINDRGERTSWSAVDSERIELIRILLFSGAVIEIKGLRAEILLLHKQESLGQWEGTLQAGHRRK
jgi:hypothetical protein